jgi:hypothetical protein
MFSHLPNGGILANRLGISRATAGGAIRPQPYGAPGWYTPPGEFPSGADLGRFFSGVNMNSLPEESHTVPGSVAITAFRDWFARCILEKNFDRSGHRALVSTLPRESAEGMAHRKGRGRPLAISAFIPKVRLQTRVEPTACVKFAWVRDSSGFTWPKSLAKS